MRHQGEGRGSFQTYDARRSLLASIDGCRHLDRSRVGFALGGRLRARALCDMIVASDTAEFLPSRDNVGSSQEPAAPKVGAGTGSLGRWNSCSRPADQNAQEAHARGSSTGRRKGTWLESDRPRAASPYATARREIGEAGLLALSIIPLGAADTAPPYAVDAPKTVSMCRRFSRSSSPNSAAVTVANVYEPSFDSPLNVKVSRIGERCKQRGGEQLLDRLELPPARRRSPTTFTSQTRTVLSCCGTSTCSTQRMRQLDKRDRRIPRRRRGAHQLVNHTDEQVRLLMVARLLGRSRGLPDSGKVARANSPPVSGTGLGRLPLRDQVDSGRGRRTRPDDPR